MTLGSDYEEGPASAQKDVEGRTRAILDRLQEAFVEIDSSGLITDWNTQAETLFGWLRSEALGREVAELVIPGRNREVHDEGLRRFFAGNPRSELVEVTAKHRNGEELQVQFTSFPVPCGQEYRMAVLAHAVGSLVQSDEDNQRAHRDLMDQLAEPYVEVDLRGKYVYFNKAYRDVYDIQSTNVRIGVSYKDALDASRLALIRETYQEVYKSGKPTKIEYPITTRLGADTYVEMSVALRSNARGEPIGFMAFVRDHSARKRHETEMAVARDAAEAASKAKSEFLANMSHEIRTPLNGVIGMLGLARETELSMEQAELLDMAHNSAKSLLGLINDILDFSKIEAGKLEFDCVEFLLVETAAQATRSLAINAHNKGLELAYSIAPDVPAFVLGDSMRLGQVLINLLGNAIKFTQHGEVVLRVTVDQSNDLTLNSGEVQLRFSVSDTGVGIEASKQKLIFDAFSQADASTTRKFGGTGLGLTICSRIVQLMGGSIWVESEMGKGSTFHATAVFKTASRGDFLGEDQAWLKQIRVLVVDDNLTNRNIIERKLAFWQMSVVSAESGHEALEIMKAAVRDGDPFRLLLADCHMPEMDGFQLIDQMRRSPDLSMPAIMMLTSNDYDSAAKRCREIGAAYVIKPVRRQDLLSTITHSLKPDRTARIALPQPVSGLQPNTCMLQVLLAEDNHVNQKLAARLLEKLGHKVVVASSGRAALDALEAQSFDLVLMDVQMPEMDGFAATAAIRAHERTTGEHLPIIALTANAMLGDRELCLNAGMDDYITKPIDPAVLKETIDKLMLAFASNRTAQQLKLLALAESRFTLSPSPH